MGATAAVIAMAMPDRERSGNAIPQHHRHPHLSKLRDGATMTAMDAIGNARAAA